MTERNQIRCDHCHREMRHGERLLIWAPMETVGEHDTQDAICDLCEYEIAANLTKLVGPKEGDDD